jgi:hypothetical protein
MDCLRNIQMHKTFLLSKEVIGFYELYYHFWNNPLFHYNIFFHDTYLIPLSLSHYWLGIAIDLGSAELEHLSNFALSSASDCPPCKSALLFLGSSQFLEMFLAALSPCVRWVMSLRYQL